MAGHHGTGPHGGGLTHPFIGDNATHLAVYHQASLISYRPMNPTSQLHQCVGFDRQVAPQDAAKPKLHSSGNRSVSIEAAVEGNIILEVDGPLHPAVIGIHFALTSPAPLCHHHELPDMDVTARAARILVQRIGRRHASYSPQYVDAPAERSKSAIRPPHRFKVICSCGGSGRPLYAIRSPERPRVDHPKPAESRTFEAMAVTVMDSLDPAWRVDQSLDATDVGRLRGRRRHRTEASVA